MAATTVSSRLIGRQSELDALQSALHDACEGRPGLAFVVGESGVGKSRLLEELVHRARDAGARVLAGECVELGEGELPFAPLVGALRPLVRSDDPALRELPAVTRATLSALLPGLADDDEPEARDARDAQPRMFEALLTAIARIGDEAPLVLIVEDIHWADRSTRDFLSFLGRNLADERVLVALSYRPDELHRRHPLRPLLAVLERTPNARRIELSGLDREAVRELARELLGEEAKAELVDRVHQRSEGNPLFVEELLSAGHGPLPPSLSDALMVRVERLPQAAQEVARALAAAQPSDHALLEALVDLDAAALRQALRDAIAGHVVTVGDDDRYAFRHVLLREVVYDDLLPGERASLHLAVAAALEARLAEAGHVDAGLAAAVAHHYHAAGDQPAALRSAIRAADAARKMHAAGDAAALFERALELWDRVPDAEQVGGLDHVELLWRASQALSRTGEDARRITLLNLALREVRAADPDDRRVPTLLRERALSEWQLGRGEASRASLDLAMRLLADDAPAEERIALATSRIKLAGLQSRFAEANALAEQVLADERLSEAERAEIYNNFGHNLIRSGEHERGEALIREAMTMDRGWGREDRIGIGYGNLADGLQLRGRWAEAAKVVEEGLAVSREDGRGWSYLLALAAELAIDRGEYDAAREHLARIGRTNGNTRVNVELRRAELALALGDNEAADSALDEAEALLVDSLEPQFVAVAGVLRAEHARRVGDLDRARGAVEASLERIEFCSDDAVRIARLATTGVAVEADTAQRARDLGRDAEAATAIARGELMLSRAQAAAAEDGPLEVAMAATAEAHQLRATGAPASQAWIAAAERWDALGRPLCAAACRWRRAESCLEHGEREPAAQAVAEALAAARRLGSGWLVGELEGLATRARLPLGATASAPGAAGAPGAAAAAPEADADPFGLTARERQVLGLVARGATNRQIGEELYMAEKTASVHVSRILAKLDVRTRTEAAAVAHRLGLTTQPGTDGETG